MEEKLRFENPLKVDNMSSNLLTSYPTIFIMQCEKLLSLVLNRTAPLNNLPTPPFLRELLAKKNLTLRVPASIPECVYELSRLSNSTNDINISTKPIEENYRIQERSRSLIVFVTLIAFVSLISIIGNLCLAKVLYSKRFRLVQTDRIVLCLALSELFLVLIDTPTEIYRFMSYSFSQTWLCRFHTFFESLFSSCIIFYHLLGAFDRFVYIHGHTSSNVSSLSKWCRRISTKTGSIILLFLPILCSLPIAICNVVHAHILLSSLQMKICVVQYTHGILISFIIFFYILPLLFSFFLHGKLIYFIRSKHHQHYLTTTTPPPISTRRLLFKNANTLDSQQIKQNYRSTKNQTNILNTQQLLEPKTIKKSNRRVVTFNTDTNANTAGTIMTTTTAAGGQQGGTTNSSNSSGSSRSSTGTNFTSSTTSPITLYKINSQATANAKRTVLLLILLLSFYVVCWAPYNIYTWRHAYQLTTNNPTRTFILDSNQTLTSFTDNVRVDLRRIIYINYSLYLLSMVSMCFSFIFYFSLNKQARKEFTQTIGCICPWFIITRNDKVKKLSFRNEYDKTKRQYYHTRYQHQYIQNNQRMKTTKFNTHPMIIPPTPLLLNDRQQNKKNLNSSQPKFDNALSKRTVLTYGCHVQCCP